MVHLELTYNEIDKNIDNIWSVLFTTGYLTKVGEVKLPDSENYALKLVIPNKEVREVFILQIQEWFKEVVAKDNDELLNQINDVLERTMMRSECCQRLFLRLTLKRFRDSSI